MNLVTQGHTICTHDFENHHDDVIKWKYSLHNWPFVWGIHQWLVNSPHKGQVTWSFDVFFDLCLNKRFSKQLRCRWFDMPLCWLCHCNDEMPDQLEVNLSWLSARLQCLQCVRNEDIENNVCTRVANCLCTHERVILVFISRVAQQRGK